MKSRRQRLVRSIAAVGVVALAVGVVQLIGGAGEAGAVPGDTWSTSFEATDPAPNIAAYAPDVNVAGKAVIPGDLSSFIDQANISGSSQGSTNEGYAKVFDGDTSTKWYTGNAFPQWVAAPLTVAKQVAVYTLVGGNDDTSYGRIPSDWQFQGSNDPLCVTSAGTASLWTTLDTQSAQTGVTTNFSVRSYTIATENQAPYLCYRLYITAKGGGGSAMQMSELQLNDGSTTPPPRLIR
jgi:hypothetical protein